jgi:hypothetical protein
MKIRFVALTLGLLLGGSLLSGCYSLTNIAVVGLAVTQPTRIDPQQPRVAIRDIVGLSARPAGQGFVLHLDALLEDGTRAHLVSSEPSTPLGNPAVVTFAPAPGPLPESEIPLVVPNWTWTSLDEMRHSDPVDGVAVGSAIHRVLRDGSIEAEETRLTPGLDATCGIVQLYLVREPGLRKQTWQVSFLPPRAAGPIVDGPAGPVQLPTTRRAALLTQDSALFAPLPPGSSPGKVVAFALLVPFTFSADTVLWVSEIGWLIEWPLAIYFGWL